MHKTTESFGMPESHRHQSPATFGEGSVARLGAILENQDLRELDDKENQSQHSFGAGSFSTGTFTNKLSGAPGVQILKYI